ncbi:gamma-butyrobetaine hydroxylase-like domain-containing protein [Rheinheimera sp.]|uniref:gamma-butyrobetaine hydroxylase-like domain-containing protein n=1 Tax=Rheinheimera sp. TaxID=1869214 RepID=UPI003D2A9351
MHQVSKLHYHRKQKMLDVVFTDQVVAQFSAELLRVLSPSAEVRGHGTPQLVANKRDVAITQLLPVGQYAVRLVFDDGHNSGLYSWSYLRQLHEQRDALWQDYLARLKAANAVRDAKLEVRFHSGI